MSTYNSPRELWSHTRAVNVEDVMVSYNFFVMWYFLPDNHGFCSDSPPSAYQQLNQYTKVAIVSMLSVKVLVHFVSNYTFTYPQIVFSRGSPICLSIYYALVISGAGELSISVCVMPPRHHYLSRSMSTASRILDKHSHSAMRDTGVLPCVEL